MTQPARAHIRLAELLGVLSFGADLGMGQPMEHVLRQCLISLRLAERMGLDEADQEVVYYTSLLAWVGCHIDAYEQAKWFGDDMALKTDFRHADFGAVTARPHRPARSAGEAAAQLRAEARAGRMDSGAAEAVLSAAGHPATRRPARPADLTGREVEVLQLLARGLSNKEIAEHLVISRRTAAHHIEHIYAKTGTTNRALASLFAASHGLIGDGVSEP
jgi:DNA-binding CsgD family transcriptional regulator